MNTQTGVIVVGDLSLGFTERLTTLRWDIPADVVTERTCYIADPFYMFYSTRYCDYNYLQTSYITRWITYGLEIGYVSEITIMLDYCKTIFDDRVCIFYPDTSERMIFVESLLTNTPLLLKYPKYFNWNYIPQVLNPEFVLWSFYPLETEDITLKLVGSNGGMSIVNSGINPESVLIEHISERQYKITVMIAHVWDHGEIVNCHLSVFDVMGNHLKDGMW